MLSSLRVTEETDGYSNVLTRKNALVVFICQIPNFRKDRRRQLGTTKYLDSNIPSDDTQFLDVSLDEDLIYKGHLLRRRSEFGHDGGRKASVGGGGRVSLEM